MKKTAMILILATTVFAFAASSADVKNKAGEAVDTAVEYTKEQKEAFVKEMESNLDTLKTKINEMKAKAGKSKDTSVARLEKEKDEIETKLSSMKKSSGKAWTKMKDGVSKAWSNIKTSMNEAGEELKK